MSMKYAPKFYPIGKKGRRREKHVAHKLGIEAN
jgi:hypothetical protein